MDRRKMAVLKLNQNKGLMMKTSTRYEDKHIGRRIRARRKILGLTQTVVAQRVGVQFQQLQKYETGMNRVSGSRLCDLSKALGVTPGYFFVGIGEELHKEQVQTAIEYSMIKHLRAMPDSAQRALLGIAQAVADAREKTAA
jgi:transcriptional regulator with XRE-family HTH domain